MSPISHFIFDRAVAAVLMRTFGFICAATIIAGVPAASAYDDRSPDAAVYGSKSERLSAPRRLPSLDGVYAQWFDPFERMFGNSGRNIAPRQYPESPRAGDDRNDSQANQLKLKVIQALRAAPPQPPTRGPLLLVVSVSKQTVTLYDAGVAVVQSPISSGTASNPSPLGIFSVVEKQWWHRSNIYSAAPMPYMQRITWEGVALHAGELPGYAASHGCIRLPYDFALRLWGTTNIGTRVIIANDDLMPVEIAHPRLFTFKPRDLQARERQPEYRTASTNKPQVANTQISMNVPVVPPIAVSALLRGALPVTTPTAAKNSDAQSDQRVTSRSATADVTNSIPNGKRPVLDAIDSEAIASTEDDAAVASPQFRATIDSSDTVINGNAEISIVGLSLPTEPSLISVERIPNDTDRPPAIGEPDAKAARLDVPPAPMPRLQAQPAYSPTPVTQASAQERVLRPGPLSILVSQRDQRMYVRKGLEPLFDTPIAVARLGQPLGTHVFMAVAPGDDAMTMRWTVVTVTAGWAAAERGPMYETREAFEPRSSMPARRADKASPSAAARDALDRLDFGREAIARISALMSVGATLIITDQGLGTTKAATATDTDFMVLTR